METRGDRMQGQAWLATARLSLLEDIGVDAANVGQSLRIAIDRDILTGQVIEAAQIVQSKDMVGMGVGIEYGVYLSDLVGKRLQPQFRRGVYEESMAGMANQNRGAEPSIFGIVAAAYRTVAPDIRDAVRGAAAQNQSLHRRRGPGRA